MMLIWLSNDCQSITVKSQKTKIKGPTISFHYGRIYAFSFNVKPLSKKENDCDSILSSFEGGKKTVVAAVALAEAAVAVAKAAVAVAVAEKVSLAAALGIPTRTPSLFDTND